MSGIRNITDYIRDSTGKVKRHISDKRPNQVQHINFGEIKKDAKKNVIADSLARTCGDSPLHRASQGYGSSRGECPIVLQSAHTSPKDGKGHVTVSVLREDGSGTREWHHLYPNGDSTTMREGVVTSYPGEETHARYHRVHGEPIRGIPPGYQGVVEERWEAPYPRGSQRQWREHDDKKWAGLDGGSA